MTLSVGHRGKAATAAVDDTLELRPWWWQDRRRTALPEPEMPATTDIAIVGGGYTGLSAALTLARSGARVCLFDNGDPGDGASSRNGGILEAGLHPGYRALARRFGPEQAVALLDEAGTAVEYLERLLIDLGIDCDYRPVGHFQPAASPAHFRAMARDLEAEQAVRSVAAHMVPAESQDNFLDSPIYAGGKVVAAGGGLHPAKLHDGLLSAALRAGVTVLARTPVLGIDREPEDGVLLDTGLGYIKADRVLICTNGYTSGIDPELQRRVIPVTSAMIATGPLDPEQVRRLIPNGRMIADSLNLLHYFRPSPDGQRILLGTRPGVLAPAVESPELARHMAGQLFTIFPDLAGCRISHCWSGRLGFSFDRLPKIAMQDRVGHALCYAGSGVGMAVWLGHKLGQKAVGDLVGRTAFDDLPFPTRSYYRQWPWFLTPAMAWYGLRDSLAARYRRRQPAA